MREEEKVLKDPVHDYIYIHDPLIWDVMNTPEVQRLRRIHQLGTAYLTYPGGEHSRFSHALGVYEVVRQFVAHFDRNAYAWDPALNRLAEVSGLLHDVGHGPFSHSLEDLFGTRHEAWSERIIRDPDTALHQVLAAVDPAFPDAVADVIGKRHPNRLVVSMVSGQLDADRLDYLMRDSIFTGVNYGLFDLPRILRVILPHEERLVAKRTGRQTVESYLLARYFMYWQVYFHPVCRAAEILLRQVLARARDLLADGRAPALAHPALGRMLSARVGLDDYLALDDNILWAAVSLWQHESDRVLADLSRRLINRRLPKYREIGPEWREPDELEELVRVAGFDPRYYAAVDEIGTVYYDYYLGTDQAGSGDGVFLWDEERGDLEEISRVSPAIRALAEETRTRLRRFYVPEEALLDPRVGPRIRKLTAEIRRTDA